MHESGGHCASAFRFRPVAAEVLLKGYVAQHLHALGEWDLLIRLPEELRIVEARAQHAFIAVADDAVAISLGIEHREKMGGERAALIFDCEILLMIAHHGD